MELDIFPERSNRTGNCCNASAILILEKDGYPPYNSSPPIPESTALRPLSLAYLLINQVLIPSTQGMSIAFKISENEFLNMVEEIKWLLCWVEILSTNKS